MVNPTVASLFTGCGGLDYGFKMAGFRNVWANEIEEDYANSYKTLLNDDIVIGDIKDYYQKIPNVDLLIGGPPCQSFSLVGKRLAEDSRSQLVFYFLESVKHSNPNVFIMENVPGIMSSYFNEEKLFDYLLKEFSKLGYEIHVQKLTATDFCVPQLRKRIFIIGYKNKLYNFSPLSGEKLADYIGIPNQKLPVSSKDAMDDLPKPNGKYDFKPIPYNSKSISPYANFMRDGNSEEITYHALMQMSEKEKSFVKFIPPGGNYTNIPDHLSTKRILNFKKSGGRTTTYGRLHPDKPSYTINTYFNRPNVGSNFHYNEPRLITVREAMRLQSFPDHFVPTHSNLRSLFTQIGNAVPPLLALGIALGLKDYYE